MYLIPQNGGNKTAAGVVFGCGTNQTGGFLNGSSVPDGLLGLGMRNISTPSILARAKVMADSFSMCFDYGTGTGRLVFGDRGSPKAHSTPINTKVSPDYIHVPDDRSVHLCLGCCKAGSFTAALVLLFKLARGVSRGKICDGQSETGRVFH